MLRAFWRGLPHQTRRRGDPRLPPRPPQAAPSSAAITLAEEPLASSVLQPDRFCSTPLSVVASTTGAAVQLQLALALPANRAAPGAASGGPFASTIAWQTRSTG
jgi:hypothetical protein